MYSIKYAGCFICNLLMFRFLIAIKFGLTPCEHYRNKYYRSYHAQATLCYTGSMIFVNVQMHCPLIIFWVLRPVYLYLFQMGSFVDRQPSRLHENCVGDFLKDIQ